MSRLKSLSLIFLLIKSICLLGQPTQTQKFLPVLAPPSPEAAGITRYGNYDVNLFTGTPQISIPIFEIKVGELSVPITLNYHASGIKVNEMASRAGLGWDLQAGGAVTRKIMGKPDEQSGYYLDATPGNYNAVKSNSEINPYTQEGLDYLNNVDKGYYDVEPDIFSYNFAGHSGKFLFNQKNNFNAFLIPYAPLAISYTRPSPNVLHLSITDESGINYKFDSTEWTATSSILNTSAIASWLLSDMISANKQDSIHFRYSVRTGAGITDSYFSDYTVVQDHCNGNYTPDLGSNYYEIGSSNTGWQQLNQVDFKNGKVVFESAAEAREDFSSAYQLQHRINAIKIYNYDALYGTYNLIRSFQFYQSYFINGTDAATKRLRLDSLQVKNGNGSVVQTYKFTYNNSILLPSNMSRMKDYWGYFNNIDNRTAYGSPLNIPTGIPKMQITYTPTNNPPTTIWIGGNYTNARDPDPNYMQAYILQKITFPTGGFTQFEYETNQYLDDQGSPKYAGGLRIKSIKSYTSATSAPIIKTYKYGSGESGYGRNNFLLANYFFQSTQNNFSDDASCPSISPSSETVRTFFANPTNDLEGYDGAAVVYPEVTEYIGDGTTNAGKTIYRFTDRADVKTDMIGYGRPLFDSYHFVRGFLSNKSDYRRNTDNTYSIVAESRKKYQYFPLQWSTGGMGLIVFKKLVPQTGGYDNGMASLHWQGVCETPLTDSYNYMYNNYDLITGDNKLVVDTTIAYDQNDPSRYSSIITNYSYDDVTHLQSTQVQTINSKNETITSSYTYPYNYGTAPYTTMTTNHIYNKTIQEIRTNNGVQLTKQITNYGDFGNYNYLPQNIQLQVGSNTIETRANFSSYDFRANPQEMQKTNDIKQAYIWDYQNIYPIAEVINASHYDIAYTSFEAEGKGQWTFNGSIFTDGSAPTGKKVYYLATGNITATNLSSSSTYYVSYWSKSGVQTVSGSSSVITGRTLNGLWTQYEHKVVNPASWTITISGTGIIDELRLYPAGALMTTMTYDPLVGMTSQCNANNQINYYYYDEFGRLELIRDQDKNTVKKFCYNYNGQQENCNFYFNQQQSGNYTKNNCPSGYTGSTVTYTIPAETYSSTLSQTDADNKALADITANGQAYANAIGTCTYNPPMITMQGYNTQSSNYNLKLTSNTTGTNYYFTLNSNTYSPYTLGQVPSDTYTVQFYPSGMPVTCTYDINGYTYYGTGATFYNISITATSTARMY